MAMWYETKKMALYDGEGDSCSFDPSILDNLNETIQYKIPGKKTKKKMKKYMIKQFQTCYVKNKSDMLLRNIGVILNEKLLNIIFK